MTTARKIRPGNKASQKDRITSYRIVLLYYCLVCSLRSFKVTIVGNYHPIGVGIHLCFNDVSVDALSEVLSTFILLIQQSKL